jgi:hypothetical protein
MTLPVRPTARIENAGLVLLGGLMAAFLLAIRPGGFILLVRHLYLGPLSQHAPRFGESLQRETLVLYALTLGAALAAVLGGLLAARRGRGALAALVGGEVTLPSALLVAVLTMSSLFVGLRAARDALRARTLAGSTFEDRRLRLHAENALEPDPEAVRTFREEWLAGGGRRGNVAILRGNEMARRLRPDHLFLAAELFPARLYLAPPPACSAREASAEWAAARGVSWVLPDCGAAFQMAPEPFAAARP